MTTPDRISEIRAVLDGPKLPEPMPVYEHELRYLLDAAARVAELEATLAESDALCHEFRLALTSIADDPLVSDIASRARSWEPDLTDARMSAAIALGRDPGDILRTEADRPPQGRRG